VRVFLAVVALAGAGFGQGLGPGRREAVAVFVTELEELADWCTRNRLYRDRNETYRVVLSLDGDHPAARKWLRYRKTAHGWVKQKKFKPARNLDPGAHPTWVRKLDETRDRFADRMVAVLKDTNGSALDRAATFREIFLQRPDHEPARLLNGQVRHRGRWVLRETQVAYSRRRELVRLARKATFRVATRRGRLRQWETDLGLAWTEVWETPTWRLVTTCGAGEGEVAARLIGACAEFFEGVFDLTSVSPRPGQLVFLVKTNAEFHRLLTKHPEMTAAGRKRCWDLGGAWTPKSGHLFEYADDPVTRREGCVRQALGSLFKRKYGLTTKHGWAWEGAGLYLGEHLTGSKYVTFVRFGKYARDEPGRKERLAERLYEQGADWFKLGREMLDRGEFPELRFLLGKNVNAMTAKDLVASYCLGAYLLEAHADRAGKLFGGIGNKKQAPGKAFEKALGLNLGQFECRLRAWLMERR